MEELIKRLERVIATGAPDKDGLHPISAETVLEVVKQLSEHGTNLAEVGTDCISRQAAIDALRGYLVGKRCPDDGTLTCRLIENEVINKLPPIQPKRGRWIRTGSGSLYDHYECSECGKSPKWECLGDNRWSIAFTDFCPNCGAKMEVNHESN